jgi:hypothetical protein
MQMVKCNACSQIEGKEKTIMPKLNFFNQTFRVEGMFYGWTWN